MLEYVPTAPDSLPTATAARAAPQPRPGRGRPAGTTAPPSPRTWSARRGCRGCAPPWRCRGGASAVACSVADELRRAVEQQVGGVAERPAQRGVDHVGRREAVVDPPAPARRCAAWTTSTNAATSWSVTRSRSSTAATKASSTTGARPGTRRRRRRGTTPSDAHASVASSSISSQRCEPGLVGEDRRHLGQLVARDHRRRFSATGPAMSRRDRCRPGQAAARPPRRRAPRAPSSVGADAGDRQDPAAGGDEAAVGPAATPAQ